MTREIGVLFKGEMVRAILNGSKTQTRRLANIPEDVDPAEVVVDPGGTWEFGPGPYLKIPAKDGREAYPRIRNRLGYPGDKLWVKETWQAWSQVDYEHDEWEVEKDRQLLRSSRIEYRATSKSVGPWRSSMFMPRWASRITLEVTEVRAQRLWDIIDDDAKAEGVIPYTPPHGHIAPDQRVPGAGFEDCRLGDQPHRLSFADLWDRINEKRSPWASNPWVFATTFRRIENNHECCSKL